MIIVIRIKGMVEIAPKVKETLFRMRLRRKYAAILLKPTTENMKLLKKVRNHVAYGDLSKETLSKLIEARGQPIDKTKPVNVKAVLEQLDKGSNLSIKPFFRLHPARGGIDSKKHFGVSKKAVLGDNKDKINDLVERML